MKLTIEKEVSPTVNEGHLQIENHYCYFRELTLPTVKHFEWEFPLANKKNYTEKVYCIETFISDNKDLIVNIKNLSFGHELDEDGIRIIYFLNEKSLKSL